MSWEQGIATEPWRYDMLAVLRRAEALNPEKPRLGDTGARRDEYLDLGQEPYLSFPASNVAKYAPATKEHKSRMLVKFLGMLGPMGPLPLSTTEEAYRWNLHHEDAFCRFLD